MLPMNLFSSSAALFKYSRADDHSSSIAKQKPILYKTADLVSLSQNFNAKEFSYNSSLIIQ